MRARSLSLLVCITALISTLSSAAEENGTPIDRYPPQPAGTEKDLTFHFGPFHVPPGHDLNRITIDLPLHNGFYTAIAPDLIDAVTGEEPSHQVAHIHHAHWFRITGDPEEERYDIGFQLGPYGVSWVFGTGEEETQGSLDDRSAVEPGGPRYGVYIKGDQPQGLIYMLHNKTAAPLNLYVLLRVRFVWGTKDQIAEATGQDFRPLVGKLWGTTFNVPRQQNGDGVYVHPVDISSANKLGKFFTSNFSGTIIAGAGHLHPAGREVVLANLGPAGSGCEADSDGDGYPGITILHSRKMDRIPEADFYSEDYQMGVTKLGFRAPIRQGDRISQFGLYSNDLYASYGAMSYAGLYTDTAQIPAPSTGCNLESYGSKLLAGDPVGGDPRGGILNHAWKGDPDLLCGLTFAPHNQSCDRTETPFVNAMPANAVEIADFKYLPGDLSFNGPHRMIPRIAAGSSLRFVNQDAALGIRHTVTACSWPCNGPYVGNYPLPNATFESGMLGNVDPIDGSSFKIDWSTPTNLAPGRYSYFCRTHPWMRGAFEVVG